MADVKPPSRRERAAATRRAIIDAATAELIESGYQATTMAGIAKRAGVATQTVYFVFHTKAALLTACIDTAVLAGGAPPHLTPWYVEATTTTDGARAIAAFVAGSADILSRAGALVHAGRGGAPTDPEVQEALAQNEQLREAGYREFVRTLEERGLLAPGVSVDDATDLMLTLVGPAAFVEATRERGWDAAHFVDWMSRALTAVLVHRG